MLERRKTKGSIFHSLRLRNRDNRVDLLKGKRIFVLEFFHQETACEIFLAELISLSDVDFHKKTN